MRFLQPSLLKGSSTSEAAPVEVGAAPVTAGEDQESAGAPADDEDDRSGCSGEFGASSGLVVENHVLDKTIISKLQGRHSLSKTKRKRKIWTKGIILLIVGGTSNVLLGILSLVWTPFNLFMKERLNMRPGLPAYDWWVVPPDIVLRVYIFNITNSERFLKGEDTRLQVQEVGPVVYLEKLKHENITFNANGTLTYTAHRHLEFQPESSELSLNDTLVVPNLSVLGISSYLHDASLFAKFGLSVLLRRLHSRPFSHTSVYDYLWNFRDPLLHVARTVAPFLVPVTNMGILSMLYLNFVDDVTVYIGPGSERRFFTMERFHGNPRFGFWKNETCDTVEGATEGVVYPQAIHRNDTLHYFRKSFCRAAPVTYAGSLTKDGISAYRFELPDGFFDRTDDPNDCYAGESSDPLISGLSDLSPCYYDFPIAASFPHFMNADPYLIDSVGGLKPQRDIHCSYVVVEPITGVPMESCARIQSNLVVKKLTGLPDKLEKFSNLTVPMFWAEYHQTGLPWYITYLLYFTVNILPDLQSWLSFIMIICGSGLLLGGLLSIISARKRNDIHSYKFLDLTSSSSSSSSSSPSSSSS